MVTLDRYYLLLGRDQGKILCGAAINSSKISESSHIMRLIENMRLESSNNCTEETQLAEFSKWTLHIGDGKGSGNENGELHIDILEDLLIKDCEDLLRS